MFVFGPLEIMGYMMSASDVLSLFKITPDAIKNDPLIVTGFLDAPILIMISSTLWKKMVAMMFGGLYGFIVAGVIIISMFYYLGAILKAAVSYIFALIITSMLLLVSPVILPTILFQQTKSIFDSWFKQLISTAMQPIMVFIGLALFNIVIITLLQVVFSFAACETCLLGIDVVVFKGCIIPGYTLIGYSHIPSDAGGGPFMVASQSLMMALSFLMVGHMAFTLPEMFIRIIGTIVTGSPIRVATTEGPVAAFGEMLKGGANYVTSGAKGIALKAGSMAYSAVMNRGSGSGHDAKGHGAQGHGAQGHDQRGIQKEGALNSASGGALNDAHKEGLQGGRSGLVKFDHNVKVDVNGDKVSINGKEVQGDVINVNGDKISINGKDVQGEVININKISINGKEVKGDSTSGDKISIDGKELRSYLKELDLKIKDSVENGDSVVKINVGNDVTVNGKEFKVDEGNEVRVSIDGDKIKVNGQEVDKADKNNVLQGSDENAALEKDNKGGVGKEEEGIKNIDAEHKLGRDEEVGKDGTQLDRDATDLMAMIGVEGVSEQKYNDADVPHQKEEMEKIEKLHEMEEKAAEFKAEYEKIEKIHEEMENAKADNQDIEVNEGRKIDDSAVFEDNSLLGNKPVDNSEQDMSNEAKLHEMEEKAAEFKAEYEKIEKIHEEMENVKADNQDIEVNEGRKIDDSAVFEDNSLLGNKSVDNSEQDMSNEAKLHEVEEKAAEFKAEYEKIEKIHEEMENAKADNQGIEEVSEDRKIDDSAPQASSDNVDERANYEDKPDGEYMDNSAGDGQIANNQEDKASYDKNEDDAEDKHK